jgi:hypothetical protein
MTESRADPERFVLGWRRLAVLAASDDLTAFERISMAASAALLLDLTDHMA